MGQSSISFLPDSSVGSLHDAESHATPIQRLISSSGVYALASVALPLVNLVLVPYLVRHIPPASYGILTIMSASISLMALATQLGMGEAFFRAYNHDYSSQRDRLDVLATSLTLLCLVSILFFIGIAVMAPLLANMLFHRPSLGYLVLLAAGALFAQNLTVPGLAWLRAENRGLKFSLLMIGSAVTILSANIVLVGPLHMGVAGSLIALGCGYAMVAVCTVPVIVIRAGMKIRQDVARNLLTFGLPNVPGLISGWLLQLSDRYLLGLLGSLVQVASYSVTYSLGWYAISIVVIGPFILAWPTTMYAIAKRNDAASAFRLVFRWFSFILLFAAFALSLGAPFILAALFPPSYYTAAPIIPVIAMSSVLYGIYSVFMVGANLRRKTWLVAVFVTAAAVFNILLNLFLIPRYGAMGAAVSTLIAYAALALLAYIGNQLIYPIPFEIGRFLLAAAVGIALYLGIAALSHLLGARVSMTIGIATLVIYGIWLFWLGLGNQHLHKHSKRSKAQIAVCIHTLQPARIDVRVLRNALTLAKVGFAVSIVDVEHDHTRPHEEDLGDFRVKSMVLPDGSRLEKIPVRHIRMPGWLAPYYHPTNHLGWVLFKCWRMMCGTFYLLRIHADLYHASDLVALLPCYIAARLRRKPLIFDTYEMPLGDPRYRRRMGLRLIGSISARMIRAMLPRCSGIITVSPPLVRELQQHYGGKTAVLVRNIPSYQKPQRSDRLRRQLGLGHNIRIALYQGYFQLDRGLDGLIRAAQFLAPDIVIVMLGQGESQANLEAMITREGVSQRVKMLPAVPYSELLEWTASADIGLIVSPPGYSENVKVFLPNKLFEYLMAGIPVLSSPLEAVEEILQTYDVGRIVTSLEPKPLGQAISAMLADHSALERMHKNALLASEHELHWDVEKQRLVALYREVLAIKEQKTGVTGVVSGL